MLYAIVAILVLIADQWLKYWVTANIVLDTGSIELIPGVFKLVNIHNSGAAFSWFSGGRWVFVALCVVFTAAVVIALAKRAIRTPFGRWTAVLTAAGAVGNCIDRIMYGYVVDMFVIEPIKFIQIFNIADLFITIGGILFCVYLIFGGKKEKPAEESSRARHESPKHSRQSTTEPEEAPRHTAKKARHAAARHEEPAPDESGAEEESTVYSIRDGEPAVRPEAEPVKEPAAPEVKKEPEAPAVQPEAPAKDDMDFSLDDIMNEFK